MMIQITDYKAVSPLILKFFKRGVITNNFMTPEGYRAEIAEGNLYYEEDADLLSLYVKRDGFSMMYFYAKRKDVIFPETGEKLVSEAVGDGAEILENNGFFEYTARVKLEKNIESGEDAELVKKAGEADAEAILQIFRESFDKYSGWLPSLSEITEECKKGLIYTVEEKGEIGAVLRSGINGKILHIKQICVRENYRKKGYAGKLIKTMFSEHIGKRCSVWTGKNNEGALKLYESLGFLKTPDISKVYMKG